MSPMTSFRYVDFYDVPRTIVLRFQNRWFLPQSAFNDELDEYEKEYSIYPLPDSFELVQFDRTKRKKVEASNLLQALQL